jgi:hypothetical protein
MRRGILKLHLVLALLAGAFLLVLGVTGSIMAWSSVFGHGQGDHHADGRRPAGPAGDGRVSPSPASSSGWTTAWCR